MGGVVLALRPLRALWLSLGLLGCTAEIDELPCTPSVETPFGDWPMRGALDESDRPSLLVVDFDHDPVALADVLIVSPDGATRSFTTDDGGEVELPEDLGSTFDIHVQHVDFDPTSWLGVPVARYTIALAYKDNPLLYGSTVLPHVRVRGSLPVPANGEFFLAVSDLRISGFSFTHFDRGADVLEGDAVVVSRRRVPLAAYAGYPINRRREVDLGWTNIFAWGYGFGADVPSCGRGRDVELAMHPVERNALSLALPDDITKNQKADEWWAAFHLRIGGTLFPGAAVRVEPGATTASLPAPRFDDPPSDLEYLVRLIGYADGDSYDSVSSIALETSQHAFTAQPMLEPRQVQRIDELTWDLGPRDPAATFTSMWIETVEGSWYGLIFDDRQHVVLPSPSRFRLPASAKGGIFDIEYQGSLVPWNLEHGPDQLRIVHRWF